jgi:hypothetical protein
LETVMNEVMSSSKMMVSYPALATLLALALIGCMGADHAGVSGDPQGLRSAEGPIHFIGSNGDWFDPDNWEGGRVPGRGDDVLIDGDARVEIDPSNNPDPRAGNRVFVRDILLQGNASFVTLPGTELQFGVLDVQDQSSFFAYASIWHGIELNLADGDNKQINDPCSQWRCGYNPSAIDVEAFHFGGESLALYLGGTRPAGPGASGPGHHAVVRGGTVSLTDTDLLIDFKYGFTPRAGDRFVIVEARDQLSGTFANHAEGDEVARVGDVALVISYEANQIVLNAIRSR